MTAHTFRHGLAAIAGARTDILDGIPGALTKQAAMGGVLLTTAGVAGVSAAFAIRMSLGTPVAVAVIVGAVWAIVILNLDRILVQGMSTAASWRQTLAIMIPRILLAAILGTVISTPLTLQIFHREIEAELTTMHAEAADQFSKELETNDRYAEIPVLEAAIATENAIIADNGRTDTSKDPRVVNANDDVTAKRAIYNAAQQEYQRLAGLAQCELDGSCGSKVPGPGDAYRTAQARADAQAAVVATAKADLDKAVAALGTASGSASTDGDQTAARRVSQAKSDLAQDQPRLDNLVALRTAAQHEFDADNAANTGILARLEALESLGSQRSILAWAQWLLAALFFSIELLPVIVKAMSTIGKQTPYDVITAKQDDETVRLFDRQRAAAEQFDDERIAAKLEAQRDELETEKQTSKAITAKVREHQREVVFAALESWTRFAKRNSDLALAQYERDLHETKHGTRFDPPPLADVPPVRPTAATQAPRTRHAFFDEHDLGDPLTGGAPI